VRDLSTIHEPVTDLFERPGSVSEWSRFRLSAEQFEFYRREGYLAGVLLLTESQVEALRGELQQLIYSNHPARRLFYEYNSNESTDPTKVLFHALVPGGLPPGSSTCYGILRS